MSCIAAGEASPTSQCVINCGGNGYALSKINKVTGPPCLVVFWRGAIKNKFYISDYNQKCPKSSLNEEGKIPIQRAQPTSCAPYLLPSHCHEGRAGRPAGPGLPHGDATGDDD